MINNKYTEIIVNTRYIIFGILISLEIIISINGYRNIFSEIIISIYYLINGYILYKYYVQFINRQNYILKTYYDNQESLFNLITDISNNSTYPVNISNITNSILSTALNVTNANSGAIFLIEENEGLLNINSSSTKFPVPITLPIKVGETIFGKIVKTGNDFFLKSIKNNKEIQDSFVDNEYISSIIIVPIIISNHVIGLITLVKNIQNTHFNNKDFIFMKLFKNYAASLIKNIYDNSEIIKKREIEREIEIASFIQKKMINKKIPNIPNTSISAFSNPAKGVSGDYINILKLPENKAAVIISDIAGKSINSSLALTVIGSLIHISTTINTNPAKILNLINQNIFETIEIDHYATIGIFTYDFKTSEIVYSNAAHLPLLYYKHSKKKFFLIDTEGLPIGIDKSTKYIQKKFRIYSGDILVLLTDGITDVINNDNKVFTLKKLQNIILENSNLNTDEILTKIRIALKIFFDQTKQKDDQSLVILKRN